MLLYYASVLIATKIFGQKEQFKTLKNEILDIKHELERIKDASELSADFLSPIRTALEIINGFYNEYNEDI